MTPRRSWTLLCGVAAIAIVAGGLSTFARAEEPAGPPTYLGEGR